MEAIASSSQSRGTQTPSKSWSFAGQAAISRPPAYLSTPKTPAARISALFRRKNEAAGFPVLAFLDAWHTVAFLEFQGSSWRPGHNGLVVDFICRPWGPLGLPACWPARAADVVGLASHATRNHASSASELPWFGALVSLAAGHRGFWDHRGIASGDQMESGSMTG